MDYDQGSESVNQQQHEHEHELEEEEEEDDRPVLACRSYESISSPADQSSTNYIPVPNIPDHAAQNYYFPLPLPLPLPLPAAAAPVAVQQQQEQQQYQQVESFWANQMQLITEETIDFKTHSLPLARIKKIMKAEEDVRMIAAEAPILFEKACEMFILELTLRSWLHTEENKRRTLQKNDIAAAIARTDLFDFLVDVIPRNHQFKQELASDHHGGGGGGDDQPHDSQPQSGPYYYDVSGQNHNHNHMGRYMG